MNSVPSFDVSPMPGASGRSYIVPLLPGEALPAIPAGGFDSEAEVAGLPGARRTDALEAVPGSSSGVYAFYRRTTQSYLDRIPIPWITAKLGSSERAGACNFRERSLSQVQPLLSSLERVPARSRRLDNADRPAKLDQDVGLSGTGCVARKSVRNRRV